MAVNLTTWACPPGYGPDNSLFHAAPGDCSLPMPLLAVVLGIISGNFAILFALLVKVYRRELRSRGLRGSFSSMAKASVVQMLGVFLWALGVYIQNGLYEIALATSAFEVACLLYWSRVFVVLMVRPVLVLDPVWGQRVPELLKAMDLYMVLLFIAGCALCTAIGFAVRSNLFNLVWALFCFLFLSVTFGGSFGYLLFTRGIWPLEKALADPELLAHMNESKKKASQHFLTKVKFFKRNFVAYFTMCIGSASPICLYILIEGFFPVGVPLSFVVFFSVCTGQQLLAFMPLLFMDLKPCSREFWSSNESNMSALTRRSQSIMSSGLQFDFDAETPPIRSGATELSSLGPVRPLRPAKLAARRAPANAIEGGLPTIHSSLEIPTPELLSGSGGGGSGG